MALGAGTRIGPYEIVSQIGEGGMGVVYRARDARLGRDVAIKLLPAGFAADADRRARFDREARAVAALSHPNILALHDTGEHDGLLYVVTELLDGETLRDRLAHGPVPVRKAIEIAVQIARGLAAAHDKGLVHRDLKPENIFLLHDGQVRILDFGLARQTTVDRAGATATAAVTDPGTVMGTVGYMAPEQVRGQAVDARTDLFALGAVLYEMLSGRRAFQRDTAAETMTAILREDPPDFTATRADVSPALDRIVRHSLEKNPAERFQTARDVAFALEALSGSGTGVSSGALPAAPPTRRWRTPIAIAVVAAIALAVGAFIERWRQPAPATVRFETVTWDQELITNARFTPDGRSIVFSAAPTGTIPRLFVIQPDTVTARPFGPPSTHLLSVSSKGELAVITNARPFFRGLFRGTLARMTMDSAPRPWLEGVLDAAWSPDGSTLALVRFAGAGMQLEYPIGHVLYRVPSGYLSDLRVSPDGKRVGFFEHQALGDDRGWLKMVDQRGTVTTLAGEFVGERGLCWSADSRLIYFSAWTAAGELYQPLTVNVDGPPVIRQAVVAPGAFLVMDVSPDGRLLSMQEDLRAGVRARVPGTPADQEFGWLDWSFRGHLSHNRKFLVFADGANSAGPNYAAAVQRIDSRDVVRLGEGFALPPSPDDRWVPSLIFSRDEIVFYPTGPGDALTLARGGIHHYQRYLQWFPDSRHVLVCGTDDNDKARCYRQEVPGGKPVPVTPENVGQVLLADDGRTLLMTAADNTFQIATIGSDAPPVPAAGLNADDTPFAWSADHRGVFVSKQGDIPARIELVDVTTGRRTPITTIGPPDIAGVTSIVADDWIDDGKGYVYTYVRELSQLYLVTGARLR